MPIGDLLARRESFGYLFVDRGDEWLFAAQTGSTLDFKDSGRFYYENARGDLVLRAK